MITHELAKAAFEGDVTTMEHLLDAGADINAEGQLWNPLHAAIEGENLRCVQLLIERGADLEHVADGSLSPLAHAVDIAIDGACQTGQRAGEEPIDIILLLLRAGADPASGLAVAREWGSTAIADLLARAMNERPLARQPP